MKNILLAMLVLVLSSQAFAGKAASYDINIGSGGTGGSYHPMTENTLDYCQSNMEAFNGSLTNTISDGAEANLLGMMNKTFSAGIVSEGILQFYKRKNPNLYNGQSLGVIAELHMEDIALLLPVGYKPVPEKKGWLDKITSFGSSDGPVTIDINMLKNQKVAAWGGSVLETDGISAFLDLNMDVQAKADAADAAKSGLPIFAVGGSPNKNVQKILSTGRYMLVGIDYNKVSARAAFYQKVEIGYKVKGKLQSVSSVGVRALLLGKIKKSKKKNDRMVQYASCIAHELEEMTDDDDTHVNWQSAYALDQRGMRVNWTHFEILDLEDEDDDE